MAFESFAEFVSMGGHGLYVWAAYSIGAGVILFNILTPKRLKNKLIVEQKRRLRREQA